MSRTLDSAGILENRREHGDGLKMPSGENDVESYMRLQHSSLNEVIGLYWFLTKYAAF